MHLWPAVLIEKSQLKLPWVFHEEEAKKIIEEAVKTAEAKKKEAVLEGKDEIHQLRDESEKELAGTTQRSTASGTTHSAKRRISR